MNNPIACVVALSLSVLLTGCINDGTASENVPFTTLGEGLVSRITTQRMEVVRTGDELNAFWLDLTGGVGVLANPPPVDFSKDLVIAVVSPQGTYGVSITSIEARNNSTVVYATVTVCGQACPPVVVQPYHVVTVSRTWLSFVDFEFSVRPLS